MVAIGRWNTLKVIKALDFGMYLDAEHLGEVLIPKRYIPEGTKPGDDLRVFIYHDSEDRLIATTEEPRIEVGSFAYLEVVAVNKMGAFLDWGLPKDLLVPFVEQKYRMVLGQRYVVFAMLDRDTNRIIASSRLHLYVDNVPPLFEAGEEVRALLFEETEIGFKAIVQDAFSGMLYKNEVFESLRVGSTLRAYVKKVREDERLDLSLYPPGYGKIEGMALDLLSYIKAQGGSIPLTDKSDADDIYNALKMSKKNFKKAVGSLYKNRLIVLRDAGIGLA